MAFDFSALRIPLIQAPMAGGPNTVEMVAAVANAGAIGSFGFAYSSAQKIALDLEATKQKTHGAINANFFVFSPVSAPNDLEVRRAIDALTALPMSQGVEYRAPSSPYYPDLEELLDPVWHYRPQWVTFHFGIPPSVVIDRAKQLKIAVGITATSVQEALEIERSGADAVIAQGIEAGGHRGLFDADGADECLGLDDLLKSLHGRLKIPVIAAGGLMTGHDIRRIQSLGARAAQMGTAFLCCHESGASPAHQRFLLKQHELGTAYTRAFSGRRAQGIANRFIRQMQDQPYLPFPIQNTLTGALRQKAVREDDADYQSLWAGSNYAKVRAMSVADLINQLSKEYSQTN